MIARRSSRLSRKSTVLGEIDSNLPVSNETSRAFEKPSVDMSFKTETDDLKMEKTEEEAICDIPEKKAKEEKPVKQELTENLEIKNGEENLPIETLNPPQNLGKSLSFFQQQRWKNLAANQEFLDEIDLTSSSSILASADVKQKPRRVVKGVQKKKVTIEFEAVPRRASKRIEAAKNQENYQNPDYRFESLPVNYVEVPKRQRERPEKRVYSGKLQNVDDIESNEELKACFDELIKNYEKKPINNAEESALIEELSSLTVADGDISKCCQDRIYDVAFHPSDSKIFLATGDKYGNLGLWDVAKEKGNYLTKPHNLPLRCLKFAPTDSTKIYTCSYDGTVKSIDLNACVFNTIVKHPDIQEDIYRENFTEFHWFDFLTLGEVLLVGEHQGRVLVVDPRCEQPITKKITIGERPAKIVSSHPKEAYFASSDYLGVKIWDLRYAKHKCVCELYHDKLANGAFFSPLTGNKLLTTCNDDYLRVFNTEHISPEGVPEVHKISHDNRTGRWLAPFQAQWHPRCEDLFIVGSMESVRRVDIFNTRQKHPVTVLRGNDCICTRNAFHPHLNLIAGTTSSGKAFLWR